MTPPSSGAAVVKTRHLDDDLSVPQHDAIIVTPATPMASPGHTAAALTGAAATYRQTTAEEEEKLAAADDEEEEQGESTALLSKSQQQEAEAAVAAAATTASAQVSAAATPTGGSPAVSPTAPLERKCSVYRMRRSDAWEHADIKRQFKELQFNQQHSQYEPLLIDEQVIYKSGSRKWQICAYCEEGICVCEHLEVKSYKN